jgi:DNA-binding response OmpR family regulator
VVIAIATFVFVAIALTIWRRRTVSASVASLDLRAVPVARRRDTPETNIAVSTALVRAPRSQPLAPVAARLEPASRLIGASGMVLWGVSGAGRHLEILAAQGYSDALLSRLGPLGLHERVLTTLACVERRVRTRPRRGSRLAGIAVPIERDERVIGVFTAEFDPASGDRVHPDAIEIVRLLAKQMTPFVAAHQLPVHDTPKLAEPVAVRVTTRGEKLAPAVGFDAEPRPRLSLVPSPAAIAAARVGSHASPSHGIGAAPAGPEMAQGRILAVPSAKVVVLGALSDFTPEPSQPQPSESGSRGSLPVVKTTVPSTAVGLADFAPAGPPSASHPISKAPPSNPDDVDSSIREARSRFIAGFRRRCASIGDLIAEVEEKGVDGPLVALHQIVHRLAGLAAVVGLPTVGSRATELDGLLEHPQAAVADIAGVRKAFEGLQAAFAEELAAESPAWAAASGAAVGAHVLLVTSDAPQAIRLVEDLQSAAYRVTLTAQGLRAISQAAADRPDVILLDVELAGELDGHDVCRRIKADPALATIPIVLVSSHASTADRMAGFALGADDYLTKPVQTVEMLLRVRWTLTRPVHERQPAPRAGGGLMAADPFVAAAREVLRQGSAALGLVRAAPGTLVDLAAIFGDDLRRKDLLGRYSETQLAVLMPGATAGIAARRIAGVLDSARAAGLAPSCAGVTATGPSSDRFIEPMLAEAESALATAHVEGTPVVVYGAGTNAAQGSVLIVDADPDVVHVIDARMKAAGLRTLVAFDGQQALHQMESTAPAVIVLELLLPKRSGFDVLARLRELPEPRPRVVIVSSRSREEDVMRAFELGADDYLTKPFNPQELLARVGRLLK